MTSIFKSLAIAARPAVLVGAIALMLFIVIWWFAEPRYERRTLSSWMKELDHAWDTSFFPYFPNIPTQAVHAIYQIGEPAIPTVLSMLRKEDSALKSSLRNGLYKISLGRLNMKSIEIEHSRALLAFQSLRERGRSAIPELGLMLSTPQTTERAAMALAAIGAPAKECLWSGIMHSNPSVRLAAFGGLRTITPQLTELVWAAMSLAGDSDSSVRFQAVHVVGLLTNHWDLARPILRTKLADSNGRVRARAVRSLRRTREPPENLAPQIVDLTRSVVLPSEFNSLLSDLAAIDPDGKFSIPLLIKTLDSSSPAIAQHSVHWLSRLGQTNSNVVTELTREVVQTQDVARQKKLQSVLDGLMATEVGPTTNNRPLRRRQR